VRAVTAAREIAVWAAGLGAGDVPDDVRGAAELHALDAAGCALAAHGVGEGTAVRALATEEAGAPQATAIGVPERVPAATAALVNGTLAHSLDFDDTHDEAVCHVSAVVTPAALATGEAVGASADDVLTAIVAGNEVVCRVGAAAQHGFHARGFHPTSVCGVFGATVAAAKLRGLDADGIERAVGLAGSTASGLFAYLSDGSPTKPLHAGWAAAAGMRAAILAEHGLRGPSAIFEDRFGLLAAYADADGPVVVADLGSRWETPKIAFKAYPACHYIHGALDALRDAGPLRAEDVTRVDATIAEAGAAIVAETHPKTPYGARFSLAYALAAQLVDGRVDAATRADRIHMDTWPAGDEPSTFAGGVRVTLADGSTRSAQVDVPYGPDVTAKATANAALAGVALSGFEGIVGAFHAVTV
jgi:2-methylcitrate dehydratase PrpD